MAAPLDKDRYELDDNEKIVSFEKIASNFYNRNFGTMAKSDFEILLFSCYIEHCLDKNLPFDDYTLAEKLGITPSRISSLKLKKELKYPRGDRFEWRGAFVSAIQNARYDEKKRLVKVHISDPNVMRKLRQFMEENGWYDEFQLNPKLFQCRLDFFISLCSKLENDDFELTDDSKAKLKELKKTYKNESETGFIDKILAGGVEEGMKSLAVTASKELILAVLNAIPMGGCAALAIKGICSVIEKS